MAATTNFTDITTYISALTDDAAGAAMEEFRDDIVVQDTAGTLAVAEAAVLSASDSVCLMSLDDTGDRSYWVHDDIANLFRQWAQAKDYS